MALFALGHTMGALIQTPDFGPDADAVASRMKSVAFDVQGAHDTWYGFYLGFGWFVSLFLLLAAALSWYLGGLSQQGRNAISPVGRLLCLTFAVGALISVKYFFIAPIVFSTVIALLLLWGCISDWMHTK